MQKPNIQSDDNLERIKNLEDIAEVLRDGYKDNKHFTEDILPILNTIQDQLDSIRREG